MTNITMQKKERACNKDMCNNVIIIVIGGRDREGGGGGEKGR